MQIAALPSADNADIAESRTFAHPFRLADFVRKHVFVLILVSVVALVPCFWHRQIEAGDLASHSYNAWLTSLVDQEKAPGLWISPQKNNILFDVLLLRLASLAGFAVGEKIAVSIAVLLFLWGAFSLAGAASGSTPWFLVPLLTMLAYGWTLNMGFFNFYISLGLSFVALAILWPGRKRNLLYASLFVPFIWMAHPLGAAFFIAAASYVVAAKFVSPAWRWALFLAALVAVFIVRLYLVSRYRVAWRSGPFYALNGSDQISLGGRYEFLPVCLVLAVLACALLHLLRFRGRFIADYFPLAFQLFLAGFFTVSLVPDTIWLPQYAEPVSLIVSRFTLSVGVLGCCALASLRPRTLLAVLTGAIALAYFSFLFVDTAKTYAMERQAEALVSQVPQRARIISTILPFRGSRISFTMSWVAPALGVASSLTTTSPHPVSSGSERTPVTGSWLRAGTTPIA